MKICNVCKNLKDLNNFCKKTSSKDGHSNTCFICVKEYNKKYDYKKYNIINKEKISNKQKQYYKDNKQKILVRTKQYFEDNKDIHKKRIKEWYLNNKDYHLCKTKNYIKNKLKNDSSFKLKETLRKRLYSLLIKNQTPKKYSASILLGCTIEECKKHLESQFKNGMNWDNHGVVWEIDHIIPCSSFDLTKEEEQQKYFHYTNLQPLFKTTEIAESFGYKNEVGNRNKYNK
jgi:hypothetical protein